MKMSVCVTVRPYSSRIHSAHGRQTVENADGSVRRDERRPRTVPTIRRSLHDNRAFYCTLLYMTRAYAERFIYNNTTMPANGGRPSERANDHTSRRGCRADFSADFGQRRTGKEGAGGSNDSSFCQRVARQTVLYVQIHPKKKKKPRFTVAQYRANNNGYATVNA